MITITKPKNSMITLELQLRYSNEMNPYSDLSFNSQVNIFLADIIRFDNPYISKEDNYNNFKLGISYYLPDFGDYYRSFRICSLSRKVNFSIPDEHLNMLSKQG